MGYIQHHAIIVTTWDEKLAKAAHAKAKRLLGGRSAQRLSRLLPGDINGYVTFVVAPDGSKEGWEDSERGDSFRNAFIEWLDSRRYEDGSSPYAWAEVQYGDDGGKQVVLRHSA